MSFTPDVPASSQLLMSYLQAPLRRPWFAILPLVLFAGAAVGLAFWVQPLYRTSTLILIESQEVPDSIVRMAQGSKGPRVRTIHQEILSRTRLAKIIEELNPYPSMRDKASLTQTIDAMRGSVTIGVRGEDAFAIEYVHTDPAMAQAVANRLAGLFIEETTRARSEQVTGAADFISAQLDDARRELEGKELALRRYKEAHMGSLPGQMEANLATLQRLQLEQQSLAASLQSARQRRLSLEQGLREPDVAEGEGPRTVRAGPVGELTRARADLAAARQQYTEEHPDVKRLASRVDRLEGQVTERGIPLPAPNALGAAEALERSRLEEAGTEIETIEKRLANVAARIRRFQRRVERAPLAEQELTTLTRDYEKLNEQYLTLLNKKLDAQMAQSLEARWKGEQFRVLDPAYLPERPYFPNKALFLGIGLALGLLTGLAAAIGTEVFNSSVKDVRGLEALSPIPALAFISSIDGQRRRGPRPSFRFWGRRKPDHPLLDGGETGSAAGDDLAEPGQVRIESPPAIETDTEALASPTGAVPSALATPGVVFEEFRALAARVRSLDRERALRCIGIVSAVPGEGKSTVAAGLALALAQGQGRVLLIDGDLRRPTLAQNLGVPPAPGVAEWLHSGAGPVKVTEVRPSGLHFLAAGQSLERFEQKAFSDGSEMGRVRSLLEEGRRLFDYVIVDCPPLFPVADAVILQQLLDGFLVVVRERYAPMETILGALDRLDADRLRGVVLNDHFELMPRYRKYEAAYYRKLA